MDSQGRFTANRLRRSFQKLRQVARNRSQRSFHTREAVRLRPLKAPRAQHAFLKVAAFSGVAAFLTSWTIAGRWTIPNSVRAVLWPDLSGLTPEATVAAQGQLRLAMVQMIVAIGAAIALLYTARNYALTRRGQVTDRFIKALERLGSEEAYIRIGGVAAMKQILLDAPDQAEDAARVLEAFIHEHTEEAGEEDDDTYNLPPYVVAAIEALGKAVHGSGHFVNMTGKNLTGANLGGMTLNYAVFSRSTLRSTSFRSSRLLRGDLEGADATGADFSHSSLNDANFTRADLTVCQLDFATFSSAKMDKARLLGVHAKSATFRKSSLKSATLYGTFTECDFRDSDLTGADLRGMDAPQSNFSGACLRRADLTTANLSAAIGLTAEQVLQSTLSGETYLPEYLLGDRRITDAVRHASN